MNPTHSYIPNSYIPNMRQKPGNLCHSPTNAEALSGLISNDCIKKLAGFASGRSAFLL